jgi:enoyl-CoA hydratase/carnithine racemase
MTAEHFVRYEIENRVAVITLDRPGAANAQTPGVLADLDDAWRRADLDSEVGVIVFMTTGKNFSAGHDMSGRDPSADDRSLCPAPGRRQAAGRHLLRLGDTRLPRVRPAVARHPQAHDRRGPGQVHRCRADAVLAVRPDRRRR